MADSKSFDGGIVGNIPLKIIVRAIGPSLPVAGKLADPFLELHDGNGALLQSNDNWKDTQEAEIIATTIPPSNNLEQSAGRRIAGHAEHGHTHHQPGHAG